MKAKFAFKIFLLVCVITLVILLGVLMYVVLLVEKSKYEWTMLIPFVIMLFGSLSATYHFKTINLYSKTPFFDKVLPLNKLLWISNLILAVGLIIGELYLGYEMYLMSNKNTFPIEFLMVLIVVLPLLLGLLLLVEEIQLYKQIKNYIINSSKDSIEDISGYLED